MIINRFETILADTATARDAHFRLRYQVFCEEARFEDSERYPDQREHDEHDREATHFIIWDRLLRKWVGAMRLVPAIHRQIPSEAIAGTPFIETLEERGRSVEFSRLCVPARYRRTESGLRVGSRTLLGTDNHEDEIVFFRQRDNEIVQRLLRASFAWGIAQGIDYCYFIITRALARMLKYFGIPLELVGESLEHRGLRVPQRYHVEAAHAGMLETSASYAEMVESSPAYVAFSQLESLSSKASRIDPAVHHFPWEIATELHAQHLPAQFAKKHSPAATKVA